MAYFDIAANSITAQPVTAYLQGRAMRMAYEGEKQDQQFQQMQMQDWQKQRDFERQAVATELQLKQQEFDRKNLQGQAAALAGIIRQSANNPDPVAGLRDLTTATGGKITFDETKDPKEQQNTLYPMAAQVEMMAGLPPHEVKWGEDERTVGDERVTYRTRDGVAQGEPIARAPRYKPGSTNVNVQLPQERADNAFGKKAGEKSAENLDSMRDMALKSSQAIDTSKELSAYIDKGVISGFAGDFRLGVARALNLVGVDNTETIANTEAYFAGVGKQVAEIISAFGAGTAVSDADRIYANKMAAGAIELNQESIRKIMRLNDKYSRMAITRYGDERERLKDKAGIEFYQEVKMPAPLGAGNDRQKKLDAANAAYEQYKAKPK